VGIAIGRCLESEADLPSIQSLSQNFRAHNTCSDGLTGTAANRLKPGYFSRGGKSVVILPNHAGDDDVLLDKHVKFEENSSLNRDKKEAYMTIGKGWP
jgi:hypothetical protein